MEMDCDVNRETLGQLFKGTFLKPRKNWFAPPPGLNFASMFLSVSQGTFRIRVKEI